MVRARFARNLLSHKRWINLNVRSVAVEQASEKENDVAHLSLEALQALLVTAALGHPDKMHHLMRKVQLNDEFASLMDWAATKAEAPVWKAIQAYARKYDKSLYRVLLEKSDAAHCATLQIVEASRKGAYQVPQQLTAALETLGTAKGSSLFNTLLHDQTKKQQRLLELQEQLGKRLDPPCNLSHLTVNETVRKLVLANREDFASNVKDEMGMSDERYIWVGVSAMAAKGDWEKIDAVWNSRGFKETKLDAEPFIVTCLEYGNVEQAAKYVPSVNLDDRFHYAMQCGLYRLAAETAVLLKEPQLLMQVERKNKDAEVRKYIMMAFQSSLGKGSG